MLRPRGKKGRERTSSRLASAYEIDAVSGFGHRGLIVLRNDFPSVTGSRSSGRSSSRSRTCASTSCTPTSTRACGSRRDSAAQSLRATPRPEPPSSPRSITMPSTISTMPMASTPPVTVVNSFWAIA
jgi:hypothetical protein